jgi:adenine phosphoribosyltransferase
MIKFKNHMNFPINGVNFIDLTPSLFDAADRSKQLDDLVTLGNFKNTSVDYIISPDARGFIWGGMLAERLGLGFLPVRKSGKLPPDAICAAVDYKTEYSTTSLSLPAIDLKSKTLMFVDDVYATGGTYEATKQLVKKAGGNLLGGIALIDIELCSDHPEFRCLYKSSQLN